MNDQPYEETRTRSNGDDDDNSTSLERETRPTNAVDMVSSSNGDQSTETEATLEPAEDVEVEVVLLSNDESGNEVPRTLSDTGPRAFRWYMALPGVLAVGGGAAWLLKSRAPQHLDAVRAGLNRAGGMTSPLQGLSNTGKGLGSMAGEQKARALALAAQAKAKAGKAPPPPEKSAWEGARDTAQSVVRDNVMTIIALAASAGLTIAGRLVDVKREGNVPEPPPAPKVWYQIGPWS